MKISVGSDHRGYALKDRIRKFLVASGHEVIDNGTDGPASVDYPVYAEKVAMDVSGKRAEKGIAVCGSGLGVCIAVNKVKGIRGVTVRTAKAAVMAAKHNNANILCLGADFTSFAKAKKIVDAFLRTGFEGGRHERRINLIADMEKR
ncbi:MAG: ribose 5-phosphate isomerase B [Elusimicrobia bacterium]|nr:ribose 5-phosphate isomerase B [Elusimicrobiota bacterium]